MKLTSSNWARQGREAAGACAIFYFCGPDEAGASQAASDLVSWLPQPGERIELSGAQLKADPALLGDEARSKSLFGDTRHIWVRAVGDDCAPALEALAGTIDAGAGAACPVIVVATGATDKSRAAKLLEKRRDAVVTMFYPPDLPQVTQGVRALADAAGLRLGGDLAETIARTAGLDLRLAKSELEKLAIYLDASPQAPRPASREDYAAIGAGTEDDGFDALVDAVLAGRLQRLGGELARMKQVGLNPVGTLLALERRAAQLARIAAALGTRRYSDLDKGEKARLGIFWKADREVGEQLARWRQGARLDRLIQRLTELHRQLLTNSQASEVLLAQGLAAIAREAASDRR